MGATPREKKAQQNSLFTFYSYHPESIIVMETEAFIDPEMVDGFGFNYLSDMNLRCRR
jgi:hypothetical protein